MPAKIEKVSVIIPLYNARPYIDKTIESILGQSFHDFHLYIIDDHSTDGSADVAKKYASGQPDLVTYFRPAAAAKRPAVGKNIGIEMSKGQYIALMDHDDWWEPNHLELLVTALDKDPTVGLAGANAIIFDSENNKSLGTFFNPTFVEHGPGVVGDDVLFEPPFPTSTCMFFRRATLDKVGAMDAALFMSDDHEIAMRIFLDHEYKIIALPTVTVYRRWHRASLSNTKDSISIALNDVDHICNKLTHFPGITSHEKDVLERWHQTVRRRWANYLVDLGEMKKAREIYRTLSSQGGFILPVLAIRFLLVFWPALARKIVMAKRQWSFDHPHLHE